jgi:hypothetical protein
MLVVQRAMNAGNDFEGKRAELVVLSATYGNQLSFRHAVGPHDIFGTLGTDHRGARFEGDVGNVQDVVVMSVSDEDKICSLNVRIDCRHVRRRDVAPPIRPAGISRHGVASRWWRSVDSRQIWIDQNRRGSIADSPNLPRSLLEQSSRVNHLLSDTGPREKAGNRTRLNQPLTG